MSDDVPGTRGPGTAGNASPVPADRPGAAPGAPGGAAPGTTKPDGAPQPAGALKPDATTKPDGTSKAAGVPDAATALPVHAFAAAAAASAPVSAFAAFTAAAGRRLQALLHTRPWLGPLAVLVVTAVVFDAINGRFLAPSALSIMFQQVAVIGLLALGQSIIILTAGIDLSVGAAMIMAQMVMAGLAVTSKLPALPAILIGMAVAMATGLVNGLLVTRLRVPPFIATLGTLSVFTAVGLKYAGGQTLDPKPGSPLLWTGKVIELGPFHLTVGVLLLVVMYAAVGYLLAGTAWGRHVYAVGDDPEAARLTGIRTDRLLLSVYLVAGLVFGIAAWVQIGRVGDASTDISSTLNLDSITAVVIGGVSLFGGRGVVLGTLFGALIVQAFQSGLNLAGVDDLYQQLAEGVLVIAAVVLDQWIRKVRR